jgi:hypothetical protein
MMHVPATKFNPIISISYGVLVAAHSAEKHARSHIGCTLIWPHSLVRGPYNAYTGSYVPI